jgi:hypothetical protein
MLMPRHSHVRVSVGQTSGAAQRCRIQDSAREFPIRDARVIVLWRLRGPRRILTNRALFGRSSRHCASLRQTSRGRVKHSQRLA